MNPDNHKMTISRIENYSTSSPPQLSTVRHIKRNEIIVHAEKTLQGDAPKQFVQVHPGYPQPYHKANTSRWPYYIVKTGHKWYPLESITEHLLNQLGEIFGLEMAHSEIAIISGQLRFLSRYFLTPDDELIHGAEIFAGYMEDMALVEEIEEKGLSRDFFTLQFVEKAVKSAFPEQYNDILHDLVKLLLYDALVGNNDRHYFNWGVIRPLTQPDNVRFSPVYDTARGLFWNYSESNLNDKLISSGNMKQQIAKYCKNSKPKLGWESHRNLNHFDLVKHIYEAEFYITKGEIRTLFNAQMLLSMKQHVQTNYRQLFSTLRITAISECLDYRYSQIKTILS